MVDFIKLIDDIIQNQVDIDTLKCAKNHLMNY